MRNITPQRRKEALEEKVKESGGESQAGPLAGDHRVSYSRLWPRWGYYSRTRLGHDETPWAGKGQRLEQRQRGWQRIGGRIGTHAQAHVQSQDSFTATKVEVP